MGLMLRKGKPFCKFLRVSCSGFLLSVDRSAAMKAIDALENTAELEE